MTKNKNSISYKGFRFVLVYSECLMFLYFFIKFIYLFVGEGDLLYVHVGFQTTNLGVSDLAARPSPTESSHQLGQTCSYQYK